MVRSGVALGVALIFLVLPLAGCTSDDTSTLEPRRLDVEAPGDLVIDESSGAILGQVVDEELLPVANATVTLEDDHGKRLTTPSAHDGAFAFSDLDPGSYLILVSHDGYFNQTQRETVSAGQITELQMILELDPASDYVEVLPFRGIVDSATWRAGPSCLTIVQPPFGTCLGITPSSLYGTVDAEPDWRTIVSEVYWTPNSAVFHQTGFHYVRFPNVTSFEGVPDFNSAGYFETTGPTPMVLRIDRPTIQERGHPAESQYGPVVFRALNDFNDVNATVFAVGAMYQQTMDLLVSTFYGQTPPTGYTALPDQ